LAHINDNGWGATGPRIAPTLTFTLSSKTYTALKTHKTLYY
jgi:hypothetical protein